MQCICVHVSPNYSTLRDASWSIYVLWVALYHCLWFQSFEYSNSYDFSNLKQKQTWPVQINNPTYPLALCCLWGHRYIIGCLLICYTYNDFNQTSVGYSTFINGIDVNVFQNICNAESMHNIVQCLTSDPFCALMSSPQAYRWH